ncbi:MAG: porin family protein [Bacteroidales bacterium]
MKYLIRLSIVLIICTMSTELFAQNFGIKGGLNLSKILAKDNEDDYSEYYKMKPGFHLGPTAEFPLADRLSFETGLLLSTKGYRISEEETYDGETYKLEGTANLLYLDIPLNSRAWIDLNGMKIYGVFGPYLGIGLSGKSIYKYTYDGQTETDEEDIAWGSDEDNDDVKRLDFGITIGAGIEIYYFQIGLTYGLGLVNISAYTDNSSLIKNRALGVSVGYKFGGK